MSSPAASVPVADTLGGPVAFEAERYNPGQHICGRYELRECIGVGGMGCVWRAHHDGLGTDVALKLTFRAAGEVAERMVREARVSAQLSHPGIVRVLDAGVAERGEPFVAMELLHGADLGKWFEDRGPIPPKTMVALILPVVEALAFVHDKGIVHRDLKPENIFIEARQDGSVQPKLLDFGIAFAPDVVRLTQPGDALGTPAYMAPEQARGAEAGIRSDLWALCVVLYEAIDGGLPFDAPNYHALLQAILHEEPRRPWFAEQHPELWKIIRRGLAKDPCDRWPDARALGGRLAQWFESVGETNDITGRPIRPAWTDDIERSLPDASRPAATGLPGRKAHWAAAAAALVAVTSWGVLSIPGAGSSSAQELPEESLAIRPPTSTAPLTVLDRDPPATTSPAQANEQKQIPAIPGEVTAVALDGPPAASPEEEEAFVESAEPSPAASSLDPGAAMASSPATPSPATPSSAMGANGASDVLSVAPRVTVAPNLKPLKDPFE